MWKSSYKLYNKEDARTWAFIQLQYSLQSVLSTNGVSQNTRQKYSDVRKRIQADTTYLRAGPSFLGSTYRLPRSQRLYVTLSGRATYQGSIVEDRWVRTWHDLYAMWHVKSSACSCSILAFQTASLLERHRTTFPDSAMAFALLQPLARRGFR